MLKFIGFVTVVTLSLALIEYEGNAWLDILGGVSGAILLLLLGKFDSETPNNNPVY